MTKQPHSNQLFLRDYLLRRRQLPVKQHQVLQYRPIHLKPGRYPRLGHPNRYHWKPARQLLQRSLLLGRQLEKLLLPFRRHLLPAETLLMPFRRHLLPAR